MFALRDRLRRFGFFLNHMFPRHETAAERRRAERIALFDADLILRAELLAHN